MSESGHAVVSESSWLVSWGVPGLFLISVLDGAGAPTMGGPDVLLLYLSMRAASWLYVAWLALVAGFGESLGSVVLLRVLKMQQSRFMCIDLVCYPNKFN
jgi:hypothetical protein